MMAHSSLFAVYVASLLSVCSGYFSANSADPHLDSKCERDCDTCIGEFYNTLPDGKCGNRTAYVPSFYTVDITCHDPVDRMIIKDPQTCAQIATETFSPEPGFTERWMGDVGTNWSTRAVRGGCNVVALNPHIFPLTKIQANICFGVHRSEVTWPTQLAAVILGALLSVLTTSCGGKGAHKTFADHRELKFHSGSKRVAAATIVDSQRHWYVWFYRLFQVITNIFLPCVCCWFIGPFIFFPVYIVLYVLPALCDCGLSLLQYPHYLVTPRSSSFFGISYGEEVSCWQFPFSIVRPFLLVGGCLGLGNVVLKVMESHGHTEEEISFWLINPSGYFKGATINPEGRFVMWTIYSMTLIGIIGYIVMSLCPTLKLLKGGPYDGEMVTYSTDEELRWEVHQLTRKLQKAAADDQEDDEDRVNNMEHEGGPLSIISPFMAYFGVLLAVIDFFAYVYKVVTFIKDSRYFLAFFMTFACTEAITNLIYFGNLYPDRIRRTITRVATSGIETIRYLSLTKWDDGICGVPSLFLTVYGLPLARPSWFTAITSVFFIFTGTKAMATFIHESVDGAMYEWAEMGAEGGELMDELNRDMEDDVVEDDCE